MADVQSLEQKFTEEATKERDEAAKEVAEKEKRFHEEVDPLVTKRDQAQAILDRLHAKAEVASDAPPAPSGESNNNRRGRPRKGQATRAEEFVQAVKNNPGMGTSDIARILDMNPNYLYRIVSGTVKEGLVRKEGRKLFVTDKATA